MTVDGGRSGGWGATFAPLAWNRDEGPLAADGTVPPDPADGDHGPESLPGTRAEGSVFLRPPHCTALCDSATDLRPIPASALRVTVCSHVCASCSSRRHAACIAAWLPLLAMLAGAARHSAGGGEAVARCPPLSAALTCEPSERKAGAPGSQDDDRDSSAARRGRVGGGGAAAASAGRLRVAGRRRRRFGSGHVRPAGVRRIPGVPSVGHGDAAGVGRRRRGVPLDEDSAPTFADAAGTLKARGGSSVAAEARSVLRALGPRPARSLIEKLDEGRVAPAGGRPRGVGDLATRHGRDDVGRSGSSVGRRGGRRRASGGVDVADQARRAEGASGYSPARVRARMGAADDTAERTRAARARGARSHGVVRSSSSAGARAAEAPGAPTTCGRAVRRCAARRRARARPSGLGGRAPTRSGVARTRDRTRTSRAARRSASALHGALRSSRRPRGARRRRQAAVAQPRCDSSRSAERARIDGAGGARRTTDRSRWKERRRRRRGAPGSLPARRRAGDSRCGSGGGRRRPRGPKRARTTRGADGRAADRPSATAAAATPRRRLRRRRRPPLLVRVLPLGRGARRARRRLRRRVIPARPRASFATPPTRRRPGRRGATSRREVGGGAGSRRPRPRTFQLAGGPLSRALSCRRWRRRARLFSEDLRSSCSPTSSGRKTPRASAQNSQGSSASGRGRGLVAPLPRSSAVAPARRVRRAQKRPRVAAPGARRPRSLCSSRRRPRDRW